MTDPSDPYYYAQNMLAGLTDSEVEEIVEYPLAQPSTVTSKKKAKNLKKRSAPEPSSSTSFVMSKTRKGSRLIKIQVLDLMEKDGENIIVSAQHAVIDPIDEILDITENLIKKISKKLCNDSI